MLPVKTANKMEQFIANGLCRGSVYALVALGFGLIYTTTGVFHIAHGFIYTLGAYGLFASLMWLPGALPVAVMLALAAAAVAAVVVETLVYRPLDRKKASPAILMISSFGVYIIGINLIAMIFGNEAKILRAGVEDTFQIGNVILTRIQIAQLVTGMLVFVAYWLFLRSSALGRICRAVADDSTLASVLGVRVEGTRMLVFALGSVLATTGAILASLDVGMDPYVGLPATLVAAVACIVGGMRRFFAPALGALLLGIIQSLVVWKTSAHWEAAVTFGILILFLVFRPQGLLGQTERVEEAK